MENTAALFLFSRDTVRPKPQQECTSDVTVGDLLVVVYLALAVVFLARDWVAPVAEEEIDDEPPEQRDRPIIDVAGG
jgi:hypothetical protein